MPNVTCPKCNAVFPDGVMVCNRCGTALAQGPVRAPVRGPQAGQPVLFRKGQLVAGRYTVIDMIGRGGMGCIYRVHDNTLNEEVALKTLLPQYARDKMVVERFFNEARIARQLSHPNIVRVHDIGVTDNILYISMELVKGKSLRALLDELPSGSRLPTKTALRIIDEICEAMKYAHQYTVHRDIKPENIMLTVEGRAKLMDFGISKLVTNTRLTAASVVMGTPHYMSPEQLKDSSRVDARADIYSVGVVLYEIVTNNLPTGVPRPASQMTRDIPPALDPIVTRCLEPNPDDRFQCAEDLQAALRPIRVLVESGTNITALASQPKGQRPAQGRKLVGTVLSVAILAAGALGVFTLDKARQEQQAAAASYTQVDSSIPDAREAEFQAITARIAPARNRALVRAGDDPHWRAIIAEGDARWKLAQQQADTGGATEDEAWHALQCYLAALVQPEGMIFVPPGEAEIADATGRATVPVDAFMIERTEVTYGRFMQFCQAVPGGWPMPMAAPSDLNLPIAGVSYYDAEAYAAWAERALPTEAEWVRAATTSPLTSAGDADNQPKADNAVAPASVPGSEDYRVFTPAGTRASDVTPLGVMDMAGNVAEWTRTVYMQPGAPGPTEAPYFGTLLVVRGGSVTGGGQYPLLTRAYERFEQRRADLGFRCVLEFPRILASVDKLLSQ